METEKVEMRKLWEERAVLERLALVSLLAEINDVSAIQKKLRRNSESIGKAVGEYFKNLVGSQVSNPEEYCKTLMRKGNELTPDEQKWLAHFTAGNMITIMLKHCTGNFINYVAAKKEGVIETINSAETYWAENRSSITEFFRALDPRFEGLDAALKKYHGLIIQQISARMDKEYDADLDAFEKALESAAAIAEPLGGSRP